MAKKKAAKKKKETPLRFDEKLVLNQWMLSLFEVNDFDKLAEHLKPLQLEGLDENNVHKFCLLYTSPSPRDQRGSRMPSSA